MKLLFTLIILFFPLLVNSEPDGSLPTDINEMAALFSVSGQPVAMSNTLDLTNITVSRSIELMLSIIVLFVGAVIIAIEVYLASIEIIPSEYLFKCILVTLVLTGSLVLITVCYADSRLTSLTMVLGGAAIYLLVKAKFPGDSSMTLLKVKKNI